MITEDTLALSVAVVAGAQRERVERVLGDLAAQTVVSRLEVVVVDLRPDKGPLRTPRGPAVRVIEAPGETFGGARALAAHAARANVLAYLEEHCCPDNRWAEALIEAHREPKMVVGYSFEPVNSRTRASRASFLASYGEWMDPAPGPVASLPSSNVSYERSLLLAAHDDLRHLLEVDFNFYPRLLNAGARLAAAPSARIAHENEERLSDALRTSYNFSRVLAAERARARVTPPARRAIQTLAALLVSPSTRFAGLLRASTRRRPSLIAVLVHVPEILAIYIASALGESLGVLRGAGSAARRIVYWELDAPRRVSAPR